MSKEYRSQTLTAPKEGVFKVVANGLTKYEDICVKPGDSITITYREHDKKTIDKMKLDYETWQKTKEEQC